MEGKVEYCIASHNFGEQYRGADRSFFTNGDYVKRLAPSVEQAWDLVEERKEGSWPDSLLQKNNCPWLCLDGVPMWPLSWPEELKAK